MDRQHDVQRRGDLSGGGGDRRQSIVARRFRVTGRVQGVGFRVFVLRAAEAEGVGGWVRNTPDGDVEGVAEGEREALDRFERTLQRGPANARVDHLAMEDVEPSRLGGRFEIR
jgi:acylphosphatase